MPLHRKHLMVPFVFCLAFGAARSLPAAEYVFPHVADGQSPGLGYVTSFLLNNVTDVENRITLSFYKGAATGPANGTPWEIELLSHDRGTISGRRAIHTIVLSPGETLNVFTAATNPITVGWARIQSGVPLNVSEIFSAIRPDLSPMRVLWEAGVLSQPATARFSFEANYSKDETVSGTRVDTGYAIANPNPEFAAITAVLYSRLGTEVSRRTILIPSNGQIAEFVSERFIGVQLPEQFHGLLRISSDINVAVCALRMSSGSREDVFSTVAVNPDLTLGYHPVNDREPSTGPGSAEAISVPTEITGSKNASDSSSDGDWYAVDMQSGQTLYALLIADIMGSTYDGDIVITDAARNEIKRADNWAIGLNDAALDFRAFVAGTYYINLRSRTGSNTSGASYRLYVTIR
jgi:hypothetical protein